ncbi:unnamed protein product, partial [Rotaria socialis]
MNDIYIGSSSQQSPSMVAISNNLCISLRRYESYEVKKLKFRNAGYAELQVGQHLQEEHDDIRAVHNDLAKLLKQPTFEIGFEHILLNLKSTQSCSYRTDLNYSTIALLLLLLYVQR